MNLFLSLLSKHAVRALAVLASAVPVLVSRWPSIPWEALAGAAASILAAGEAAQRHTDAATASARDEQSPWDAAAVTQAALADLEAKQGPTSVAPADEAASAATAPQS
jgi:hypothetical protein